MVQRQSPVRSATVKTYNQTVAAGSNHDGYTVPEDISMAKSLRITSISLSSGL